MDYPKVVASQFVLVLAYVEGPGEERQLLPPIDVNVTDLEGEVMRLDFDPGQDELEIRLMAPRLPITIRLTDATDRDSNQQSKPSQSRGSN